MKLRSIDEYELKPVTRSDWGSFQIDGDYVSYEGLITSDSRVSILQTIGDGDYQGQAFGIAKFEDGQANLTEYGLFSYSYGSCSVCDELEGAESISDIEDIRDSLLTSIKWFSTIADAEAYLRSEEIKGTHWYYESDISQFSKAVEQLKEEAK